MSDWISWNGGECPVPEGTVVKIKRCDGKTEINEAQEFDWGKNCISPYDVIAFRLHEAPNKNIDCQDYEPKKGDYVLATKWMDGDPGDPWAVGFFDGRHGDRYHVVDAVGGKIRASGFRRVAPISQEFGKWLLQNAVRLEQAPPGSISLWGMMEEYAFESETENWQLEGGKYRVLADGNIDYGSDYSDEREFGTERPTRELAEKARDAMRVHNRALAYVHEHCPDWDGSNAYVVRNIAGFYEVWPYYGEIGVVVGPLEIMQKLADDLNAGRVEL